MLVHKTLEETQVLGTALAALMETDPSTDQPTRHLLLPYAEAGLDQLEVFLEQPGRARIAATASTMEAGITGCESSSDEGIGEEKAENLEKVTKAPAEEEKDKDEEEEEEEDQEEQEERLRGDQEKVQAASAKDAPEFLQLDKGLTLQANLRGRAIMEFPVLHVALPKELARFGGARSVENSSLHSGPEKKHMALS